MKHYFSVLALLALPACLGGGGGSSVSTMGVGPTPSAPSVPLNTDFGALMNNVRMNTSVNALTYDGAVGQAAQQHANDMVINNYFSITIPGSDNGNGQERDIGDRVTDAGYTWVDIEQLIAQGDMTTAEAFAAFADDECDASGTICIEQAGFTNFGIAKAGSGGNQKWVFVMVEPPAP